MKLSEMKVGQKVDFVYDHKVFQGTITKIIPLNEGQKYIVESEEYAPLWLYDGDEEEWQVSVA